MLLFLLILVYIAIQITADLPIDKESCTLMGAKIHRDLFGDIEDGLNIGKRVAKAGAIRMDLMLRDPEKMSEAEQDRVDELLVAFMSGRAATGEYSADEGLLRK